MSGAYYNENDPKAAAWLRELIKEGHIANGVVDERSIEDILPSELEHYTQCHFFAGIGGWSYALRLAGWPDDRHVWTGSCPCQPFSAAGKGAGFVDERHLWPAFHWLISQCRPAIVFGEQVASAGSWLDLVSTDMEAEGYTMWAAVLGAHSVGAPHIRQRFYWVADDNGARFGVKRSGGLLHGEWPAQRDDTDGCSADGRGLANTNGGNASSKREQRSGQHGCVAENSWACEWIPCTDGKWRPVEPGTFPLAHGVPKRVGLLRGYGNAIVPQVAAAFIEAYTKS